MNLYRFCDSHCHLDADAFAGDRAQVLDRCYQQGVRSIVVPGIRAADWQRLLTLCRSVNQAPGWPRLLPALGLHPCFMKQHQAADLELLARMLESSKPIAIGEIGLDFWHGDQGQQAQQQLFEAQLDLAQQTRLPVLLHVRKAHDQVLKLLRRYRLERGGIVHAFSGSQQQAENYLELGFKLGVGGAVTYPRAKKLRRTLLALGPQAWVLETDAPDMPLNGYQGQRNRPDYLTRIFSQLVELFDWPVPRLSEQLWENTEQVLGPLSAAR